MLNKEQQVIANQIRSLMELLPVIGSLERQLNDNPTNMAFMANTVFVTRKSVEILDALKKQLNQLEYKTSNQGCICFARMEEQKYSTDECTISPNPSFYAKFPNSPKDEGFEAFVRQLPTEAIRPHYPTMIELIDKSLSGGGQLPYGLKNIDGVEMKFRLTAKKEL